MRFMLFPRNKIKFTSSTVDSFHRRDFTIFRYNKLIKYERETYGQDTTYATTSGSIE